MKLPRNTVNIQIPWLIIAISMCISLALFMYAITLPESDRIRGDASQYLSIANNFKSLFDAVFYIGDRTYGFPFFLYIIKIITAPMNWEKWTIATSYVQFVLHIISCVLFYLFFLKKIFQKAKLSNINAALITGMLIAYPTLITYTTTPLTDTFCVDLFMIAYIFYLKTFNTIHAAQSIVYSILCGLLLGYSIMTRPSFLPPIIAFYFVLIFAVKTHSKCHRKILIKKIVMVICTFIMMSPTVIHFYKSHRKIALQNHEFFQSAISTSLQDGLSAVRVYWSGKYNSFATLPGIRDSFLVENYSSRCQVDSVISLGDCLISRSLAIPVYFGKKTIALFDVPHIQPYAVDLTPNWFTNLTRLFEVITFCGFIALIILTISHLFLKIKPMSIDLPWSIFILTLIFMQSLLHVEGRYGFPAIPFSLASLFLGFAAARQAGNKFFILWTSTILISGVVFLYQIYRWDLIPPV